MYGMFYYSDCGHIIEAEEGSMMVSDGGWKDYTSQHLGNCPVCNDKYPYLKYLDESVGEDIQRVFYRLWSAGFVNFYIPTFQNPVETIRVKNAEVEEVEKSLNNQMFDSISDKSEDVVIKIN